MHDMGWIFRICYRLCSHCNLGQEHNCGCCESDLEQAPRPCRLMDLERSMVMGHHQAFYWDLSVILKNSQFIDHSRYAKSPHSVER
jgi:hypothetical protein